MLGTHLKNHCKKISLKSLKRKCEYDTPAEGNHERLARVMGPLDLTALGVGATLGLGPFVLVGEVARDLAGPAVCVAYIIAALAAALSATCYSELAARVPKAGSAYVYSYVTVGEFVAFIIGWNLILEYAIGTASIGRGLSDYINVLLISQISEFQKKILPMKSSFFGEYADFLAFLLIILLTCSLLFGVKESFKLNKILVLVSMLGIVSMIIAAATKAKIDNWKLPKGNITRSKNSDPVYSEGGFAPFGFTGIFQGAAKCFYAYVGFDAVTTSAEEAKNPKRNIPLAIAISFAIIFVANFGLSIVLTLMVSFNTVDIKSPFPAAFGKFGDLQAFIYVSSVAAVSAFVINIIGMMFPLPRVLYCMGTDGLLFKFFSKLHGKSKTPVIATITCGVFAGLMALVFSTGRLVDMMSIGTLLAFTIVAAAVLILRYQAEVDEDPTDPTRTSFIGGVLNLHKSKHSTIFSAKVVKFSVIYFSSASLLWGFTLTYFIVPNEYGFHKHSDAITILIAVILSVILFTQLVAVFIISRQPTQKMELAFRVPLVPVLPCFSIFMNFYLMLQLDDMTWKCFSGWIVLGLILYFTYGVSHSVRGKESRRKKREQREEKQRRRDEEQRQMNGQLQRAEEEIRTEDEQTKEEQKQVEDRKEQTDKPSSRKYSVIYTDLGTV